MRKKKKYPINKLIDCAKNNVDETLNKLAELDAYLDSIKQENIIAEKRIKQEKLAAEKLSAEKIAEISQKQAQRPPKPFIINQRQYFVLPNIDTRIEEAIADAIIFFEKKCPYCETNLYGGHFRNKIEIDHFIPLSKGGQHVPWNILPVCKKCNRGKSAKTAKNFLEKSKLEECKSYLETVRGRLADEIQINIERYQELLNYIIKMKADIFYDISNLNKIDLRKILIDILKILDLDTDQDLYALGVIEESIPNGAQFIDTFAMTRVSMFINGKSVEATIGELIILAYDNGYEDDITGKRAQKELKRYGVKIEDEWLLVANNSTPLRQLLKDTQWHEGWRNSLMDVDGAEKTLNVKYFSPGISSRAVKVPVAVFNRKD